MSKSFQRGLIVGKFCPLHRGHEHAIRQMMAACEQPLILSYTNPEFAGCEPEKRRRWLSRLFPEATVLVLDAADVPHNDADELAHRRFVGDICRDVFKTTVDAVFTSEDYGDGFAQELSRMFGHAVRHVSVDPARTIHPVSGTLLRDGVHANRAHLSPVVYADFAQRICLFGGESTGKSTLTEALSRHYQTQQVDEYGRELWELKDGKLEYGDMLHIGQAQVLREDEAAGRANRFLFCDTSPLTTLFYSHAMFGMAEAELERLAARPYALHVLCTPDFPFVQDGTRQDETFRMRQDAWYRSELERQGLRWIEVGGPVDERVRQVEAALDAL
ncbi:MAG TPA: AAA family ATPase [Prosthecobacter sp.]